MKKVLLLGTDTMLGHIIYLFLKEYPQFIIEDYFLNINFSEHGEKMDIFSPIYIKEMINNAKDTVIINTISVLIEESNNNFEKSIYINSFLPNYISSLVKDSNNKFIHISTDCVFSGNSGGYDENAVHDATDNYGKTKSLGEVSYCNDLTLRTSKIGPCLENQSEELLDWFLKQNGTITGYKNAIWNGVTTLELAKMIKKAIELNLSGIYNVAPFEQISKFDLLSIMNNVFKKGLNIEPYYGSKIDKSLIDTRQELRSENKNYYEMFVELRNFMQIHSDYYEYYNL